MTLSPSALIDSLSLRPEGATADELHTFFLRAGIPAEKLDLVRILDALHRNGRVTFGLDRRWRISSALAQTTTIGKADEPFIPEAGVLTAVPAHFSLDHSDTGANFQEAEASDIPVFPPEKLLAYYEAGLRRDARGSVTQVPSRHGYQFQSFFGNGAWWPEEGHVSRIRIRKTDLPDPFREALSQRADAPLAIGWPLAVVSKNEGSFLQPIAVMGTERLNSENALELAIPDQLLSLNSDWQAGPHARFRLDVLRGSPGLPAARRGRTLFPHFRSDGFCRPARRSSGLADLPEQLDPRRLVERFSLDCTAIVNAAALFLAVDSAYTRGAVNDLARLQKDHIR